MIALQYGTRITSPDDELKKVPLDRLYHGIRHPKTSLFNQIERLRMIRTMDQKQYARLKRELPYFVCGHFHPARRRREHFSSIECFVIDLDHFHGARLDRTEIAEKLSQDERVLLLFTSPGGDGLKVLFRLAEKCFDPGLYSYFYKAFLQKLVLQYQLEQVADLSTHDVSRACFLSYDPKSYFNPDAIPIQLRQHFDPMSPDATKTVQEAQKALREQAPQTPQRPAREALSDEVLLQIKQRLNPNFRPRRSRKVAYVPPELEKQLPELAEKLRSAGIELQESLAIQYGKKLRLTAGPHLAEINIFFGKRGFSIVKTTKTGTSTELAELAYQVIYEYLMADQEKDINDGQA